MPQFDTFGQGNADANGDATAIVPGPPPGQTWRLVRLNVSIPTMTTTAIVPCRVYRNIIATGNLIAATRTGQLDTDPAPNASLSPGEQLIAQWSDATPGALCRIVVAYEMV